MSKTSAPITRDGEVIGGYRVGTVMGAGAVGVVVRATPPGGGEDVALKVMPPAEEGAGEMIRITLRAATVLSAFPHPNLCRILGSGYLNDGRSYVVMELLQGVSLKDLLKQQKILPEERAVKIACQVLSGLAAVHEVGIVHRDIKPANIYLVKDPSGEEQAKILDFGIAYVQGAKEEGRRKGAIYGTATYVSPEQIRGLDPDGRADLYAVGVLLFRMLTGQVPFRDPSPQNLYKAHLSEAPPKPRELSPKISPFLEAVILKALNKKPEARFQSAKEFIQALKTAMQADKGRLLGAEEEAPAQKAPPPRPAGPPLWAITLLSGLIGGALFAFLSRPTGAPPPAEAAPERFSLRVEATPEAQVLRQGAALGKTPLDLKARPGEWLLLRAPNHKDIAFQVSGAPSQSFSLEPEDPKPEEPEETEEPEEAEGPEEEPEVPAEER